MGGWGENENPANSAGPWAKLGNINVLSNKLSKFAGYFYGLSIIFYH
jgi:hypothetical protein